VLSSGGVGVLSQCLEYCCWAVAPRSALVLAPGFSDMGGVGGVPGVVEPDVSKVVLGGLLLGVLLVPEFGSSSLLPHEYLHAQD